MTGYGGLKESVSVENESQYVNDLNSFYCRFDCLDFSTQLSELRQSLQGKSSQATMFTISEKSVLTQFKTVNTNKVCGPDKIKGKLLKACCEQLAPIYAFIFNQSLHDHTIPTVWKTSEIIPVPKKPRISTMNDLRPVALTSIVFKCFEKIVLSYILNDVSELLDPIQFAYKKREKC